jgi:hypothetical protein
MKAYSAAFNELSDPSTAASILEGFNFNAGE